MKKKNSGSLDRKLAVTGVSLVVLMIAFAVGVRGKDLRSLEESYIAREQELEKAISEETARKAELTEQKYYVRSTEYYQEVARDRLGLVSPGEIIIQEED